MKRTIACLVLLGMVLVSVLPLAVHREDETHTAMEEMLPMILLIIGVAAIGGAIFWMVKKIFLIKG